MSRLEKLREYMEDERPDAHKVSIDRKEQQGSDEGRRRDEGRTRYLYFRPGSVRMEDQGIVTADGYENLISATYELIEL